MRVEGESGRPACSGNQVIGRHRQSCDHWTTVQRARNGTAARTCLVIPRHRFVDRSRMAFSKTIILDTTPELAANSAISLSFCVSL